MIPFWISISCLSLVQGAVVAVPSTLRAPRFARMHGRLWAAIPPASIIAFVLIAGAAQQASAQGLTYLALVAVPILAALCLALLGRGARRPAVLLVPVLFALAWAYPGSTAGQLCALALTALSCASLGVLLATVTPELWLAGGIVAMAIADSYLVATELLQSPNNALNAASPGAGLPRLQSAVFGTAVMGYGDLFIAGALGGLIAANMGRGAQRRAALLTALLALAFDLLFFLLDELPATVPVAGALVIMLIARRYRSARREDPDPRPRAAAVP